MDQAARGEAVATHCPYCAMQCGMTVVQKDGRYTVQARDFPTNKGGLCSKGWTAAELLDAPGRLTTPLLRDVKDAASGEVGSRLQLGEQPGRDPGPDPELTDVRGHIAGKNVEQRALTRSVGTGDADPLAEANLVRERRDQT